MTNRLTLVAGAIALCLCPSMSYAKTLIPSFYNCNFDDPEGRFFCATTCINMKTQATIHIDPPVCRLTPGWTRAK
jgi:hypothetical protein